MEALYVVIVAVVLFVLFFKIIGKSFKLIFKLALNTIIGACALIIVNMIGTAVGITITVNLVNCLVVAVLGLPGVVLLLLLKWLNFI